MALEYFLVISCILIGLYAIYQVNNLSKEKSKNLAYADAEAKREKDQLAAYFKKIDSERVALLEKVGNLERLVKQNKLYIMKQERKIVKANRVKGAYIQAGRYLQKIRHGRKEVESKS